MRLVSKEELDARPYDPRRRGPNGGIKHPIRKMLEGIAVGQVIEITAREWPFKAAPCIGISGWFRKTDKRFKQMFKANGWYIERVK